MFVRWKRRKRVSVSTRARKPWRRQEGDKFLLTAALVRSERHEGKPRQKVVAYLGSIAEERAAEAAPRKWFWDTADAALDALGVDPDTRRKVEARLCARVPRLSAAEATRLEEERKALGLP